MSWQAFHIFYHEDPQRLVIEALQPLLERLDREQRIRRSFFVFYHLGGPHVRLRVEGADGVPSGDEDDSGKRADSDLAQWVLSTVREFLAAQPSRQSMDPEVIGKITTALLEGDPFESDSNVYPDNHVMAVPYQPEVERYGGLARLDASLDLFTVSSRQALAFLTGFRGQPRSRQYPEILRLLFSQALGLASSLAELQQVLIYASASWGKEFSALEEKADHVFDANEAVFSGLLESQVEAAEADVESTLNQRASDGLYAASRVFRGRFGGGDSLPLGVSRSHVHMTANRFAIKNPEEVYLGRLAERSLEALSPSWRQRVEGLMAAEWRD